MNKKLLLSLLPICLITTPSFAKVDTFGSWRVMVNVDDFTDEVNAEAWAVGSKKYNDYKAIGLRCMKGDMYLTYDTVSYVSSNNSYVMVKARIDKNETEVLLGRNYSNSNSSGWLPKIASDSSGTIEQEKKLTSLIEQMKKGNRVLMEVSNTRRSNIEQVSVSLSGFTKAFNKVKSVCK